MALCRNSDFCAGVLRPRPPTRPPRSPTCAAWWPHGREAPKDAHRLASSRAHALLVYAFLNGPAARKLGRAYLRLRALSARQKASHASLGAPTAHPFYPSARVRCVRTSFFLGRCSALLRLPRLCVAIA